MRSSALQTRCSVPMHSSIASASAAIRALSRPVDCVARAPCDRRSTLALTCEQSTARAWMPERSTRQKYWLSKSDCASCEVKSSSARPMPYASVPFSDSFSSSGAARASPCCRYSSSRFNRTGVPSWLASESRRKTPPARKRAPTTSRRPRTAPEFLGASFQRAMSASVRSGRSSSHRSEGWIGRRAPIASSGDIQPNMMRERGPALASGHKPAETGASS
mmetsp:Transcript_19759/g.46315  ORF Transcript_19759/g.46315 Transcript_19759/m.46315 type:complete len:220 (+) Transcript_19759:4333-4992(+)